MRFIGDVHGKFSGYKNLIRGVPASRQVGDMGVGFRNHRGEATANPPHDSMKRHGDHRFIRGNHDNPGACRGMELWIPDGTFEESINTFFVGGAASVDRQWRTENYDWWADEELSYAAFQTIIDEYEKIKPRIMVTHDAPDDVVRRLFHGHVKFDYPSITRQALNVMWGIHQPELWFFGHYHKRRDWTVENTRFICLTELDWADVDMDNLTVDFNPNPRDL